MTAHSRACGRIGVFTIFNSHVLRSYLPSHGPSPRFQAKPWYKPEPQGLFRLLQHLQVRLGLLKAEDLPGVKYMSQGYRLEEMVS